MRKIQIIGDKIEFDGQHVATIVVENGSLRGEFEDILNALPPIHNEDRDW